MAVSAGFGLATGQGPATAFAGSVSVNRVIALTEAILDSVDVTASGAVTVTASDTTDMWVVGGGIAVSTGAGEATGVGISIAYNQIASRTRAAIRGTHRHTTIHVEGGDRHRRRRGCAHRVGRERQHDPRLRDLGRGRGRRRGGAAVGATVAINLIADDLITGRKALIEATVADATSPSRSARSPSRPPTTPDPVDRRRARARAAAGRRRDRRRGQGRRTQTSAASTAPHHGRQRHRDATSIESDGLLGGKIVGAAIGAGLGISQGPGVGDSVAVNVVTSTVASTVASTATHRPGDIGRRASDSSSIRSFAGGIGISGTTAAVGFSLGAQRQQWTGHLDSTAQPPRRPARSTSSPTSWRRSW